ncbi:AraC family transcriptional regulator [Adhaeribacter rhizoryzae]|uniref:AraC family transcriptional regulator n=1 Tax=Adhaeribacter rhizoryzae TaxID=2607907 RepID=A0A5M6D1F4_9BACT|nr:AraC family transcriptional regulator [Adhaeribacter rhizoryzae]KAA5540856.1 AraC family transcriptional regulator [Adhaeribacter rhizoryzae]
MKPQFHKVPVKLQNSYSARHDKLPNFGTVWHYHPELELHYVIKGEGVRLIGDNISNFSAGEIILLGQNLPHTWRCRDEYFEHNPELSIEAVVIHFLPDCLGPHLLQLPEAYLLPRLFEKAQTGMVINGSARETLAPLMLAAVNATNLDRLIILLTMLKILAETTDFKPIASFNQVLSKSSEPDNIRLNKVWTYTLTHYKKEISLEEIAAVANLSVTSFCRYFKLLTKKTYYDFLIEIRVSHACRLLIENKLPTEVVCFECGFNNVSNFYRHFKKVTGLTPLLYKRQYLNT